MTLSSEGIPEAGEVSAHSSVFFTSFGESYVASTKILWMVKGQQPEKGHTSSALRDLCPNVSGL